MRKARMLNRHKMKSLKLQIIVSYMMTIVCVLTISTGMTYNVILGILKNMTQESTIREFQQTEQNFKYFEEELRNITITLSTYDSVQGFIESNSITPLERTELFNDFAKSTTNLFASYRNIDSVFILKNNGEIFGNSSDHSWNIVEGNDYYIRFIKSSEYLKARNSFPNTLMIGNTTSDDFVIRYKDGTTNNYANSVLFHYISFGTVIKSLNQNNASAVMIINVDERKLNNIYTKLTNQSNTLYVLDSVGIVVSDTNQQLIGSKKEMFDVLKNQEAGKYFFYKNGTIKEQVIYHPLGRNGWVLVNEIPYNIFTKNITDLKTIIVLLFALNIIIILIFYSLWINRITKPLKGLLDVMKEVGKGEIGIVIPTIPENEIGIIINQFNLMSIDLKRLMENNKSMEEQKRKLEVEILQHQINPHFLYNTLNTIKWMAIVINAKNIADSITILGNLIRPIFKNKDILCPLREELEYLQNYKAIMAYRFDDDIVLDIQVKDEVLDYKVLKFMLQPLMENSFLHGYTDNYYNKLIHIKIYEEVIQADVSIEVVYIELSDNGIGMEDHLMMEMNKSFIQENEGYTHSETNIGLRNVNDRIRLHFGKRYGLRIEKSETGGVRIVLCLPKVV